MGLQFYVGGSGQGKSTALYTDIVSEAVKRPDRRFFVLVPEQFSMQTEKELVRLHPDHGLINIEVLSFGRLAYRIFDEVASHGREVLDDTGKCLILRRAAAKIEDRLPVIGRNLRRPGYIQEVKSAISELMQYGIDEERLGELTEAAKGREALRYKLKDLGLLFGAFREELADRYITGEETLKVLSGLIKDSRILHDAVVTFDGYTGFTPVQYLVIRELLKTAAQVRVSLLMDAGVLAHPVPEHSLFALTSGTAETLKRICLEENVSREPDRIFENTSAFRFGDNEALSYLERNLFRYGRGQFKGDSSVIKLISAENVRSEVEYAAISIRKLIRSEGWRYSDMAVVCADLGGYADILEACFEEYGIPVYLDNTRGLVLNPLIEFIKNALLIPLKNFSYESIMSFLRCGLCDIAPEEADCLDNYLRKRNLRGKGAWSKSFGKGENEETATLLEDIRTRVINILTPLLNTRKTGAEHILSLYSFLENAGVHEKLSDFEAQFEKDGDTVRQMEYSKVYRVTLELLELVYSIMSEEELSEQEFLDLLDAGFGEITLGTIPQRVDRVVVGDMERSRIGEVKALFFLGVNDGLVPRSAGSSGIISDMDREFLLERGFELSPTVRRRIYTQRLYLYMLMTKPSERLFISCAGVGVDGKGSRPSYLMSTVRQLMNIPDEAVVNTAELGIMEKLDAGNALTAVLPSLLREFAAGQTEEEVLFSLLRTDIPLQDEQVKNRLSEAAFRYYTPKRLSEEAAFALYGGGLRVSVSRLESFAGCAFRYFLRYGMKLELRQEAELELSDLGNLYHSILEHFGLELERRGLAWTAFTDEEADVILRQLIAECADSYRLGILYETERNRYILSRLERILKRTVTATRRQLKKGLFRPLTYELDFRRLEHGRAVSLQLSENRSARLDGKIDRIDLWEDEDDIYVKVVDYKSSAHSLKLDEIYHGFSLQLPVYLNAAVEYVSDKYPGRNIHPAAMLYCHVHDPYIDEESPLDGEQLGQKLFELQKPKGIIAEKDCIFMAFDTEFNGRSDVIAVSVKKDGSLSGSSQTLPEDELELVSRYVTHKMTDLSESILDGDIAVMPQSIGSDACAFCEFGSICGISSGLPGYEAVKAEAMSPEEALDAMREALGEKNTIITDDIKAEGGEI